jgi:Flp pilus assembly protein TadG
MRLRRCATADDGASAVEFALVLPILLLILFGIIDYGLWFEDSISLRQGVRDAARQGVVGNYDGGDPTCAAMSTDQAKLRCLVDRAADPATGKAYAAIRVIGADGSSPGGPPDEQLTLRVCAMVSGAGATGFVPLPGGGVIRSRVEMKVERDGPTAATSSQDADAPGDWAWCDE